MEYIFKVLIFEGLHARPCAKLVSILQGSEPIKITCNSHTINNLSILELLLLKAAYGSEITIACEQPLLDSDLTELTQLFGGK